MNKFYQWIERPQVWGFFVSIAVIALVSIAFFYPDNFESNSLRQADMQQGAANGHEAQMYYDATGEKALWTDALFGGMPTFQISPNYPSNGLFTWLNSVYGLGLPSPSNLLFMMMFGFLILLYVIGLQWYYALIGSIAWGLSSYFVIIIGAGHIWKFVTLAYIPPTIGGLILCYKGRYLLGGALTALFAMLQLNANHPQMSYYFAFVMVALVIAYLVQAIKAKSVRRWAVATAVVSAAGLLAVGANSPSLYHTYEYAKETKRSQSELTPLPSANAGSADRPTGGMPRADIIGWSYGKADTASLLIPNIRGGASAKPVGGRMVSWTLDQLPDAKQYENSAVGSVIPYLSQYYNDSEGTNGPVYVGAVIFALFVLGCFVVRGPIKWALLCTTVLSIILAWGANFESLTDLMIYHFPLYNKFRAVESILVIAEFTIPLLAIITLSQLLANREEALRHTKKVLYCFGGCALFCLFAVAFPGAFGEAITATDRATVGAIVRQVSEMAQQQGYSPADISAAAYQYSLANPEVVQAVEDLRFGLLRADAWRSLIFVLLSGGLIYLWLIDKVRRPVVIAGVAFLTLIDLYTVDKRYVDHASFVKVAHGQAEFTPDDIDLAIMADTTHFRVLDEQGFYRADRSYFHHTIGGYHAAKLIRYEDLLQRRLNIVAQMGYYPELRNDSVIATYPADYQPQLRRLASSYRTLDMLNAKYVITGDAQAPVIQNTFALGAAWPVGRLTYVDNADAEMAALDSIDPAVEAVADRRFEAVLGEVNVALHSAATVALERSTPNSVVYNSSSATPMLAVFSEIWFPWGWKATIDGQPAEIGRVNYVLRAMTVPAGKHRIEMVFDPDSVHTKTTLAYASISLIYLLLLAAVGFEVYGRLKR